MYAKFQLSRLTLIFISYYSCYQLLTKTADTKKSNGIFTYVPNLSSIVFLGVQLQSVMSGRRPTSGRCRKLIFGAC